jgi:spore germination cell wall hydrolase CwlJ-like protein
MKVEALKEWRKLRRRRQIAIAATGVALIVVLVMGSIWFAFLRQGGGITASTKSTRLPAATSAVAPLNLPPPDLLRPIAPEEALKQNAERPFSDRPDTAAGPFNLKADAGSVARAQECLTQAVYYEAASEGADGQRAVAQIVLNRMRHPAYPSTVCGVIYQGSDRPTGCQFTFTCDGSLARVPVQSLWKQARTIATQALAGKVFAPVGHATHYHADYVLPFWADSLDKSVQVGRHIFYRLKGGLGAARTFSQRYGGREPEPPPPSAVEVALEAIGSLDPMSGAPTVDTGLQVTGGNLVVPATPEQKLLADTTQGTLLLDGDAPRLSEPKAAVTPKKPVTCGSAENDKRLRPISADDRRTPDTKGC